MRKIRPIDVPEDLIEEIADRLKIDTDMAADLIVYLCNVVAAAVVDFDVERHFDYLRRNIEHLDCYAPAKLPPR